MQDWAMSSIIFFKPMLASPPVNGGTQLLMKRGEVVVSYFALFNLQGPTYLGGWILAFVPWTVKGEFILNSLEQVKSTGSYGKIDTSEVPASSVAVPVQINDNGVKYHTHFHAGTIMSRVIGKNALAPSIDWALVIDKE